MKILWLDDMRNPFTDGLKKYLPHYSMRSDVEIVWAKSYEDFVDTINKNGLPDVIAFDHDLGEGKSGFDCAKWLVDYCLDNNKHLPQWAIQSANPVGAQNINSLLNNFNKYCAL